MNCNQLPVIQSEYSCENFLLSLEDSPIMQNQLGNRDIGPWGQENPKLFEIYSKKHKKQKKKFYHNQKYDRYKEKCKKKSEIKNDQSQCQQFQDQIDVNQNNPELNDNAIQEVNQQDFSNSNYSQKPIGDFSQNLIEFQEHDDSYEQLKIYYQNGPIHSKKQMNSTISSKNGNKRYNYQDNKLKIINCQNSIILQKDMGQKLNFDEKVFMESLNIKSIQNVYQSKQTQVKLIDYDQSQNQNNSISNNIINNILPNNSHPIKISAIDKCIQNVDYDQKQYNQMPQIDIKGTSKYFTFYPKQIQKMNQSHNMSLSQRNSILLNLKQEMLTPPQAQNKSMNSPSVSSDKNDFSFESTQLQQALINQSLKFQRIKSLRSRFKSNSNQSSKENMNQSAIQFIKLNNSNQNDKDFILKQNKSTQEEISQNIIPQSNCKEKIQLKGWGYDGRIFDPQFPHSQKDNNSKQNFEFMQQVKQGSQSQLSNSKYPHQIAQKQQQIQEYSLLNHYQPLSARENISKEFKLNEINKFCDFQHKTNSFQRIRNESKDSQNQICQIKNVSKNIHDQIRSSSLKINQNVDTKENINSNNNIRQQYFNNQAQQKRNTHKFPQLKLSSILNKKYDDDKFISHNYSNENFILDEVIKNSISSTTSKNPQSQENLPKLRQNYHQNNSFEKKNVNLYNKQKNLIHQIQKEINLSPNSMSNKSHSVIYEYSQANQNS